MGNCINPQAKVSWEDEDLWNWDLDAKKPEKEEDAEAAAEQKKAGDGEAAGPHTEIKIKMTKKQLEELLKQHVDGRGLPIHQLLAHILDSGAEDRTRPWRPNLQTIPEIAE